MRRRGVSNYQPGLAPHKPILVVVFRITVVMQSRLMFSSCLRTSLIAGDTGERPGTSGAACAVGEGIFWATSSVNRASVCQLMIAIHQQRVSTEDLCSFESD
jgi:hypothetical protein